MSKATGAVLKIILPQPCLMLVTEPHPNLVEIVAEAVAGGVNAVQWRDNHSNTDETFDLLWGLADRIQGKSLLLINTGGHYAPYLLRKIGAQGVHLPEQRIEEIGNIRGSLGKYGLVGASVHSVAAAQQAVEQGADYLIAGTIFASQSHPDITPAGTGFLRSVCTAVSVPVVAIGGITPEGVKDCIGASAVGVAVLSPMMRAEDPRRAALDYRSALDMAWEEIYGTDD